MKINRNFILLFSHQLTREQEEDAKQNHLISEFILLPPRLKDQWSNVPPGIKELRDYIQPFKQWLSSISQDNDMVLIQGDFGVVFQMVHFCLQKNLVPVYSTTFRKSIDKLEEDGTVKTEKIFMHHSYRYYQ